MKYGRETPTWGECIEAGTSNARKKFEYFGLVLVTNISKDVFITVWVSDEEEFMVARWKGLKQIKADGGLKSWPRQLGILPR